LTFGASTCGVVQTSVRPGQRHRPQRGHPAGADRLSFKTAVRPTQAARAVQEKQDPSSGIHRGSDLQLTDTETLMSCVGNCPSRARSASGVSAPCGAETSEASLPLIKPDNLFENKQPSGRREWPLQEGLFCRGALLQRGGFAGPKMANHVHGGDDTEPERVICRDEQPMAFRFADCSTTLTRAC